MSIEYKPHLLEWTDEKVARFWNHRNNNPGYDDTWFTQQVGDAVANFVHKHVPIKGKVLDYGTGKGFLLDHLIKDYPAAELYACDFTDSLASEVDEKYRNHKGFKGCAHLTTLPSGYDDNVFDLVFLVETIEHLTDNYLHGTMQEIHRILKPGGAIVITTPNDEKLERTYVHCTDCGATFHHMQHIRSWNAGKLGILAQEFQFSTVFCEGVNIQWYGKKGFVYYAADQARKLFTKPHKNNLVYIGKKR